MLQLLFVVLMTIHLLSMNIASVGPLFCIWLRGLRRPTSELRDSLGNSLAWLSLTALIIGMATGGLLLLVTPTKGLIEALYRLPVRAYWIAGSELLFTLHLILVYAKFWKKFQSRQKLHAFISLLATTNLLYHFPPMMAIIGKLATNPSWTSLEIIQRPDFRKLMLDSEIISLSIHFTLASVAVAALALLYLYSRLPYDEIADSPAGKKLVRTVAIVALIVTTLQIPIGIWVLSALSGQARNTLMGGNLTASLMLIGGMLMTFVFLQHLTGIALGDVQPSTLRRVGLLLVVLVLFMTATLRSTRLAESKLIPTSQKKAAVENSSPRLLLFT